MVQFTLQLEALRCCALTQSEEGTMCRAPCMALSNASAAVGVPRSGADVGAGWRVFGLLRFGEFAALGLPE